MKLFRLRKQPYLPNTALDYFGMGASGGLNAVEDYIGKMNVAEMPKIAQVGADPFGAAGTVVAGAT
jgi:hypothetical protein